MLMLICETLERVGLKCRFICIFLLLFMQQLCLFITCTQLNGSMNTQTCCNNLTFIQIKRLAVASITHTLSN